MKRKIINYQDLSKIHGFPLSAKYDQSWMFDNSMGPNPLWLTEWVCRDLKIQERMLVLDMGSGKAISSIFLAKEYGCTVFSNDLWISPEDNLERIAQCSCSNKVYPIKSEAHSLPYAKGFFDIIICIDAYFYFGTDDMYLNSFSKYVKVGGKIAVVVPGWQTEQQHSIETHKDAFPEGEYTSFHSKEWWEAHFSKSGVSEVEICDSLPNGKYIWLDSAKAMVTVKTEKMKQNRCSRIQIRETLDFWNADVNFLMSDLGDNVAIHKIIARRTR